MSGPKFRNRLSPVTSPMGGEEDVGREVLLRLDSRGIFTPTEMLAKALRIDRITRLQPVACQIPLEAGFPANQERTPRRDHLVAMRGRDRVRAAEPAVGVLENKKTGSISAKARGRLREMAMMHSQEAVRRMTVMGNDLDSSDR